MANPNEPASLPVNGNYMPAQPPAQPPAYDLSMQNNGVGNTPQSMSAAAADQSSVNTQAPLAKDEVGWYFVEQYYTTMSKSPEKLYLFYAKRSQFISGSETERVDVCVGQKAISDRIKHLDIQDCKVRVTNVDAQASADNILIQVIGEMSTKKQPQRKFTQTFVLATQTNGYFVLNDIFRYVVDDDEDVEGEELQRGSNDIATGYQESTATRADAPAPHTLTNSHDAHEREQQARLVDQGLQGAAQSGDFAEPDATEPAPAGAINGEPTPAPEHVVTIEDTAAAATLADDETAATPDPQTVEAMTRGQVDQIEKPVAPEPTPTASPPKPKAAQPVAAPAPAVPKTWATMAAAANRSNAPTAPQAQAQSQPQIQAPAASTTPKPAPIAPSQAPPAAVAQDVDQPGTPVSSGSEWQTTTRDHGKKQTRPQQTAPAPAEQSRAYIKNVSENITNDMLRADLSKYGELQYCDINRQKNCAFADFAAPAGYQAAVAANPHEINGERIVVEERRLRPNSFGGFGQRGGMGPNRGRGGFPKDNGRGNFGGRGRGGNPNRGGRGASQAAA